MPGEYPAKVAKDFVEKTCFFLDGNFGFQVYQNCYEGKNAATVLVDGERIRFDIVAYQRRRAHSIGIGSAINRTYFFCECKWRKNPKYLKSELKKFLKKGIKTTPEIKEQYSDNFGFIFICNQPFEVNQANLQDMDYLRKFLDSDYTANQLNDLSNRIGILLLHDWFLETATKGGV
jgi:hypothetical protein